MNRKLKLALAALLGFSAACSSVKNAPKEGKGNQESDQVVTPDHKGGGQRIMVMYGVRTPDGKRSYPLKLDSLQGSNTKTPSPELDPVTEKVED